MYKSHGRKNHFNAKTMENYLSIIMRNTMDKEYVGGKLNG
jgi:hypothetical protein